MALPVIKTRDEQLKEEYEANPDRTLWMALLSSLGASTGANRLPDFSDQNEVERKAIEDFRRNDFSDAFSYIDSLVKIADFWQQWASDYHSELVNYNATFDSYGTPSLYPFAVVRNGEVVGGNAEVFDVSEPNEREAAIDYLRRQLPSIGYEPSRERAAALIIELEAEL